MEYLTANPPQRSKITLAYTSTGCVVTGRSTYIVPLPEELKTATIHALLHELIEPANVEADLLGQCELRYQAVDDWDGPGQVVGGVFSAPAPAYELLKDLKIYGNIMSVMTTMICENIGSDHLECKPA